MATNGFWPHEFAAHPWLRDTGARAGPGQAKSFALVLHGAKSARILLSELLLLAHPCSLPDSALYLVPKIEERT